MPSTAPAVLFLPAAERGTTLVAGGVDAGVHAAPALELFRRALSGRGSSSTAPALALVDALESCCTTGVGGVVLLIEEPELFLRPQAQRYLYRLLRQFAAAGNQVIYSTHSPAFLNVVRLDELVFVERLPQTGTRAAQPEPVTPDDDFRILTELTRPVASSSSPTRSLSSRPEWCPWCSSTVPLMLSVTRRTP